MIIKLLPKRYNWKCQIIHWIRGPIKIVEGIIWTLTFGRICFGKPLCELYLAECEMRMQIKCMPEKEE